MISPGGVFRRRERPLLAPEPKRSHGPFISYAHFADFPSLYLSLLALSKWRQSLCRLAFTLAFPRLIVFPLQSKRQVSKRIARLEEALIELILQVANRLFIIQEISNLVDQRLVVLDVTIADLSQLGAQPVKCLNRFGYVFVHGAAASGGVSRSLWRGRLEAA